jgi:hypothetical protein
LAVLPLPRLRLSGDLLAGFVLACALIGFAFLTRGGVELAGNTWGEIGLALVAAVLGVAVALRGAPGRPWGAVTVSLFGALVVLTALSISWSVKPDDSWLEANRTLSYFAAFASGAALARLLPGRWAALLGAIAVLATISSSYALMAKVFPAALDPGSTLGRVRAPFGYWNAVGIEAALGVPAVLWLGSRREPGAFARGLAAPAMTLLISTILLSYSRSALIAAVIAAGLFVVLVPARLRAIPVLLLGIAGAALITAWALSTSPLTRDHISLGARVTAGQSFAVLLLLVLLAVTACGFAAAFLVDRVSLSTGALRRVRTALIVTVALLPLGGVAALASSSRGLFGEISHAWNSLTNSTQIVGDVPQRLIELPNSRPRYWSEAIKVGEHAPIAGVGAGAYGTARPRYTTDPLVVTHAHSYLAETFADLGLLGLGLSLLLLIAWARATAVTLKLRLSRGGGPRVQTTPERAGLFTMLCVVVAFGVQSAIDWSWFIPGTTVPVLICAGWLAGRGPFSDQIGLRQDRLRITKRPAAIAGLTVTAVLLLLLARVMWQPLGAAQADSAALAAAARGDSRTALSEIRTAQARNPLAVEPLWDQAAIFNSIGDEAAGRAAMVKATRLAPQSAATWRQLGLYELGHQRPQEAVRALQHALGLARSSYQTIVGLQQAEKALRARGSAP